MSKQLEQFSNNYLFHHILYEQIFSVDECEQLQQLPVPASSIPGHEAYAHAIRRFIPQTTDYEWVTARLSQAIATANQYFNFELTALIGTNILAYETGSSMAWHVDIGLELLSTRKLTGVVLLSDPSDYQGGQLEWFLTAATELKQTQGSMLIFPAYVPHRVTPVVWGSRQTLIAWAHGPAFR